MIKMSKYFGRHETETLSPVALSLLDDSFYLWFFTALGSWEEAVSLRRSVKMVSMERRMLQY